MILLQNQFGLKNLPYKKSYYTDRNVYNGKYGVEVEKHEGFECPGRPIENRDFFGVYSCPITEG